MQQETVVDLQAEQVRIRCDIAALYSELLQITPPSRKIVNAAHDWSMRNIETLVKDLIINIPNQLQQQNPYSQWFLMSGANLQEMNSILERLVEAMDAHSAISTKIEQFGKGVC